MILRSLTRHFFRLLLAQDAQDRRGDVLEGAVGAEFHAAVVGHQDERHGIGGVVSVGAVRDRVDHGLGVAVVGADDPGAFMSAQNLIDAGEAGVDGFDGADGRLHFAGMAHHIGVGEVHDDHVEVAAFDGFDDDVGDAGGAHLRLQIVSRDLR